MSRLYKAGDTYSKSFTVCNSTGAAADADSTPTGTILLNGASDATVVTVTKVATGQYKATASALPGTAGDVIELLIAATVGGIATKAVVDAIRLVAFSPSNATSLGLTNLDATISSRSTYAGGAVASVTAPVQISLSQTGLSPRALDAIADGSLTIGDCLVAAVCGAAGKETVSGTSYVVKTPSTGTVIRTFTLDSATLPTART